MRKLILLIAIVILTLSIQAQTRRITLAEGKIYFIDWEIQSVQDVERGAWKSWSISFQNAEYEHLTDIGIINGIITEEGKEAGTSIDYFINTLREFAALEKGVTYRSADGMFYVYDFNPNKMYIQAKDGEYIIISYKSALKLANQLAANKYLLQ